MVYLVDVEGVDSPSFTTVPSPEDFSFKAPISLSGTPFPHTIFPVFTTPETLKLLISDRYNVPVLTKESSKPKL